MKIAKIVFVVISAVLYIGVQFFKMLLDVANGMGKK